MITSNVDKKLFCFFKPVAFRQCVFSFVIQYTIVYLNYTFTPAASCHSEYTPLGE